MIQVSGALPKVIWWLVHDGQFRNLSVPLANSLTNCDERNRAP